ncbi:hypothetical protein BDF19DRAFT_167584 [Syncephalis fuscata]|nr:hypothetical protein BDF19DRAFT_167584 [Syncephalis fuscata]
MIAQAVFASLFLSHQANYDAHGHMAAFTFLVVSGMLRCLGAVPFMGLGDPISLDKLALSRKSVMSKGTDTASDVDSVVEKPRFDVEIENAAKQTTTWQQLFNCRIDSP